LGYAHVGGKVSLAPEGIVEVEMESVTTGVGEGADVADLAAVVVTTALSPEDEQAKEKAGAVIASEMEAMHHLMDGSAMAEHLEPLYLENLKEAIDRYFQRREENRARCVMVVEFWDAAMLFFETNHLASPLNDSYLPRQSSAMVDDFVEVRHDCLA